VRVRALQLDLGAWRSEEQRREAEGSFELECDPMAALMHILEVTANSVE